MTFGLAIIQTPVLAKPRLASTCGGLRYDCGKHGNLTVKQIADLVGASKTAIYKRLHNDVRGEALCAPRWASQSDVRRKSPPRRQTLALAFRLALLFPDRVPSVEEIQAFRPMSTKNAQVWRQALATAREEVRK